MTKPIVGGRASICTWSVSASFLTKKQAVDAIHKLLNEEIDFNVKFEKTWDTAENKEKFHLTIEDMSWANNLTTVAKILEEVDYNME